MIILTGGLKVVPSTVYLDLYLISPFHHLHLLPHLLKHNTQPSLRRTSQGRGVPNKPHGSLDGSVTVTGPWSQIFLRHKHKNITASRGNSLKNSHNLITWMHHCWACGGNWHEKIPFYSTRNSIQQEKKINFFLQESSTRIIKF